MTNTRNEVQAYFDQISEGFAGKYAVSPSFIERVRVWERHLSAISNSLPENALSLDLGCGSGEFSIRLARRGIGVVGIDQSEEMLRLARANSQACDVSERTQFRAMAIPLTEAQLQELKGRFDLIISSSVLEYIDDIDTTLEQIASLLKPSGIALISLPNKRSLYRIFERVILKRVDRNSYLRLQRHQFDPDKISELMAKHGLTVTASELYSLPLHKFFSFFLGERRGKLLSNLFVLSMVKSQEVV